MDILNDIKYLKEHYTAKWQWYLAAIERLENDIQLLWNDYFLDKNRSNRSTRLQETEKSFQTLRMALDYFRENANRMKKRLDELDGQEYAIINNDDEPLN